MIKRTVGRPPKIVSTTPPTNDVYINPGVNSHQSLTCQVDAFPVPTAVWSNSKVNYCKQIHKVRNEVVN